MVYMIPLELFRKKSVSGIWPCYLCLEVGVLGAALRVPVLVATGRTGAQGAAGHGAGGRRQQAARLRRVLRAPGPPPYPRPCGLRLGVFPAPGPPPRPCPDSGLRARVYGAPRLLPAGGACPGCCGPRPGGSDLPRAELSSCTWDSSQGSRSWVPSSILPVCTWGQESTEGKSRVSFTFCVTGNSGVLCRSQSQLLFHAETKYVYLRKRLNVLPFGDKH